MPRKKARPSQDENARMLGDLADLLDAHSKGTSLARHQAAAYRDVIRRILKPPKLRFTDAENLEMRVAMAYAIRRELSARGNFKADRGATARAHNVTDGTVSTYSSRWRREVSVFLEIIISTSNPRVQGLSRAERLQHELEMLE